MKSGLYQAALAAMEIVFAGQQAVAEQHTRALEHPALGEIRLVGDEHVLDPVRVIQQVGVVMNEAKTCNIAAIVRGLLQKRGGIPEIVLPDAQDRAPLNFGRAERDVLHRNHLHGLVRISGG